MKRSSSNRRKYAAKAKKQHGGGSPTSSKRKKEEVISLKKLPLALPDFPVFNVEADLKAVKNIVQKNPEIIVPDDLDRVQNELENCLVAFVKRKITLKRELGKFGTMPGSSLPENVKGRIKRECISPPPSNSQEDVRRRQSREESRPKPFELMSADFPIDFMGDPFVHHVQHEESPLSPHLSHKFDVPIKFWKSVEPYCAPVTKEHVAFLEGLLKDIELSERLLTIPSQQSPKYFREFLTKDLIEWRKTGRFPDSRETAGPSDPKKSRKEESDSDARGSLGPVTQRAVASLIRSDGDFVSPAPVNSESSVASSTRRSMTSRDFANGRDFDEELQRVLESNGFGGRGGEDELLKDYVMSAKKLNLVASTNKEILTYLLKQAKTAVRKEEVTKKLDQIDQHVLEMHLKMMAAKQKKKVGVVFTTKDTEMGWKYLIQRQELVEELKDLNDDLQKSYATNPLDMAGPSRIAAAFSVENGTNGDDRSEAKLDVDPNSMEISK